MTSSPRPHDYRMIAMFVITILIFVMLAWRSEINRNAMEENRAAIERNSNTVTLNSWLLCEKTAANTFVQNSTRQRLADMFAELAAKNPASALVYDKLITIYTDAILDPPQCGPQPTA